MSSWIWSPLRTPSKPSFQPAMLLDAPTVTLVGEAAA